MARNKQSSQRTAQPTADGYENFVARVGMQTPNQHSASTYRANSTSRNRMLVEWSYRGSWVAAAQTGGNGAKDAKESKPANSK